MTKRLFFACLSILLFKFLFFGKVAHAEIKITRKYSYVDPKRKVPAKALAEALEYFERHEDQFSNRNFLAVIDYSKNSSENRFHIIDLKSGDVTSLHVSHGRGSDKNRTGQAELFSNVPQSNATSLGYFVGAETYSGKHGYSLKLDGLSPSNSNARNRAIVIHGADYVQDAPVIQGRSFGCPAVSLAQRDFVINALKGGSLIFATN
ncbi:hypothetical protein D3C87_1290350 [compost metagenome]